MSDDKHANGMDNQHKSWWRKKTKEIIFLSSIAGMSTVVGFGTTLALAKKQDPDMFAKGLLPRKAVPESGGALAMRALGWGTLYAVSGVSVLCLAVWTVLGAHSMEDFSGKVRSAMPRVPKKEAQGKSDFATVRELIHYILDEDEKNKRNFPEKASSSSDQR